MTNTYLNEKGEIEDLTYKEIAQRTGKKISWTAMHEIHKHKCLTQQDRNNYNFIKKYVGRVTIFDFNNFTEWGYLQLYPHFTNLAISNGATDLRLKQGE